MDRHGGKGLLRDRRGAVLILVAFCLVVLVGFGALAVDASYLYLLRNRLQSTADASALAGASQLNVSEAVVKAEAIDYASKNMPDAVHGTVLVDPDVVLGHWDMATRTFIPMGTDAGPGTACSNVVPLETDPNCLAIDAVEATTRRDQVNGNPVPLFLARVLGFNETDIVTAAIAVLGAGNATETCLIALDPSAWKSLEVGGESNITSDSCGVCVNSTDPEGLWLNGEPVLNMDTGAITVNAAGGAYHSEGVAYVFPTPTYGGACTDPLASTNPFASYFADTTCAEGTKPTVYAGGEFSAEPVGEVHLSPGLYCGGISLKSTGYVVFEPGVYHIKNGTLLEEGTHTIFGEGVTFLIDNATVDFGGAQDIELSAGAEGTQFLFYENPDGPRPTREHIFRGDANANYEGIIYTPDRNVEFVGETFAGEAPPECFAVIANKFLFTGTTDVQLNSAGCGGMLETLTLTLRLVD